MSIRDLIPWKKQQVQRSGAEAPVPSLHREMDRIFDTFFRGMDLPALGETWGGLPAELNGLAPRVDVAETDKEIRITAELPGLDDKDIDVSIDRNAVTIKGEKKEEHEEKDREYYRMERSFGSFRRTVPIPVEINPDKAQARYAKGVLTLILPKTGEARKQFRRIPIKEG